MEIITTTTKVKFSDEEKILFDKMFALVEKISKIPDYCNCMGCPACPFSAFCCEGYSNTEGMEEYISCCLNE